MGYNVDVNNIKIVEYENYLSYTFKITRGKDAIGLFENLVIEKKKNSSKAYIIAYIPDEIFLANKEHPTISNFSGKIKIENITKNINGLSNKSSGTCSYTIAIDFSCACPDEHLPGQFCTCDTQPFTKWISIDYECSNNTPVETDYNNTPNGSGGPAPNIINKPSVSNAIFPQDPRCPAGSGKIKVGEVCVCPPNTGKVEDANGNCGCPEGKIENLFGICTEDPCSILKDHLNPNKTNIKAVLEDLKLKVDSPSEKGWSLIKNGKDFINQEIAVSVINFNSVTPPTGLNIYGAAHVHIDGMHNMFSWSDIHLLYSLYEETGVNLKDYVISYLIGRTEFPKPIEVYSIIVDDISVLKMQLKNDIMNIIKSDPNLKGSSSINDVMIAINEDLRKSYDQTIDFEKVFLKRYQNHGIKLFKADTNINKFSELILNSSTNIVEKKPCK